MAQSDLDEIRARAYKLWEEAGKPEGRIDELWYEADEQLKAERVRHELKTPDSLTLPLGCVMDYLPELRRLEHQLELRIGLSGS